MLTPAKEQELARRYASLNPLRLRREIDAALEQLWRLAVRPGTTNTRTNNTSDDDPIAGVGESGDTAPVTGDCEVPVPPGNRQF
jgi:hypothetical protein